MVRETQFEIECWDGAPRSASAAPRSASAPPQSASARCVAASRMKSANCCVELLRQGIDNLVGFINLHPVE
jgi:hypothetical protein